MTGARTLAPTVVVCAYTLDRWEDLRRAVDSVRSQTLAPAEIVVVVDHEPALLERARRELEDVHVVPNTNARGLSGARNAGVAAATGDVVAFLDDDAAAEPDWLERLVAQYDDETVVGVGGLIEPAWDDGRPPGFPEEFNWVVGCSYTGLPQEATAVRNVLGANMSFRLEPMRAAGGFREGIGRIGTVPLGCEETELCIRLQQRDPAARIMYEPAARVRHRVRAERGRWGYFRARCFAEGRSKAIVSSLVGRDRALATERAYASRTLPRGIVRGVADAVIRFDPAGLRRASAIAAGLLITALGFAFGSMKRPRRQRPLAGTALAFDVHGLRIEVDARAPTSSLLGEMLNAFRVPTVADPQIVVSGTPQPLPGAASAENVFRYSPAGVEFPHATIAFDGSRVRIGGAGELLTTLLPVIDHLMIARGTAMVHAATVSVGGGGVCIGAWGGAGKTSTVAAFLARADSAFMGDDWAFVTAAGELLGYAKPMFMKVHHRAIYPNLFARKRKPLVPSRLLPVVGRIATAVHPIITRYPRLARITRHWSPEHWVVQPTDVFPPERIARAAPLRVAVFLERHDGGEIRDAIQTPNWMAARLVANFHAELPRQSQEILVALASASIVDLGRLFADKTAILEEALTGVPCYLLQVPRDLEPRDAASSVVSFVTGVLDRGEDGSA